MIGRCKKREVGMKTLLIEYHVRLLVGMGSLTNIDEEGNGVFPAENSEALEGGVEKEVEHSKIDT